MVTGSAEGSIALIATATITPIYVLSYFVADFMVKQLKLEDWYKWLITSINILVLAIILRPWLLQWTSNIEIKDKNRVNLQDIKLVFLTAPIYVISYVVAIKATKNKFISFLIFMGVSSLLYFLFLKLITTSG